MLDAIKRIDSASVDEANGSALSALATRNPTQTCLGGEFADNWLDATQVFDRSYFGI